MTQAMNQAINPQQAAQILDDARLQARETQRLTTELGDFPLETAYEIQDQGIRLRQSRGEKIVGYKMGLTSKAKMEQMGLSLPIYGVLTDAMQLKEGGSL